MSLRSSLFSAWIALALLLGGASAAGWMANAALQLLALVILLLCLWRPGPALPAGARPLAWLAAAFASLAALSLLPLPPGFWTGMPGREAVANGYRLLGMAAPSLPLSFDAHRTTLSALSILVPVATFLWGLRLTRDERAFAAKALLLLSCAIIVLGALQLFGGRDSPLRFYQITIRERSVGTFANPNHMATLLLISLSFGAALVGGSLARKRGDRGKAALWFTLTLFLGIGIALNGSLAGYALLLPTSFLCFLIYRKATGKLARRDLLLGVVGIAAFAGLSLLGPLNDQRLTDELNTGSTGRTISIPTTLAAARAFMPYGSGLGTFRDIYRTYENPDEVSSTFINHAHNDYAEVALELGVPGLLLLTCLLAWWGLFTWRAWRADFNGANLARAASVALGVVALHSLVDYPARTAAIAAVAGLCCAFMLQPPASRRRGGEAGSEAGAPKHLSVT